MSAPPAIGGRREPAGRIRRSSMARPALPRANPTASSTTSQIRYAADWWPSLTACSVSSTIEMPLDMTSTKMNASTPTENIASATRVRLPSSCSRPTGSPRKIVKPASAPRAMVCANDK